MPSVWPGLMPHFHARYLAFVWWESAVPRIARIREAPATTIRPTTSLRRDAFMGLGAANRGRAAAWGGRECTALARAVRPPLVGCSGVLARLAAEIDVLPRIAQVLRQER